MSQRRRMRRSAFPMGVTIDRWGPSAWNTLHSFAYCAPATTSAEQQATWKSFLTTFGTLLPCPTCRKHFETYLNTNLKASTFTTRENLVRFLHDAHNDVNARTGKRLWTYEEHIAVYSRPVRSSDAWGVVSASSILVLLVASLCMRRRCKEIWNTCLGA